MPLALKVSKFIYSIKGYVYNHFKFIYSIKGYVYNHFLHGNPICGTYRILYADLYRNF